MFVWHYCSFATCNKAKYFFFSIKKSPSCWVTTSVRKSCSLPNTRGEQAGPRTSAPGLRKKMGSHHLLLLPSFFWACSLAGMFVHSACSERNQVLGRSGYYSLLSVCLFFFSLLVLVVSCFVCVFVCVLVFLLVHVFSWNISSFSIA